MATLLMLPGRFGGAKIDHTEFRSLREAADGGSRWIVEKVWTAIKDWFCGTKVGEAKECLAKLYSSQTTDEDKYLAFHQLKALASFAYQNRFVERAEANGTSIWLYIASDATIFKHTVVFDARDADPFGPFFSGAPLASFDSYESLSSLVA